MLRVPRSICSIRGHVKDIRMRLSEVLQSCGVWSERPEVSRWPLRGRERGKERKGVKSSSAAVHFSAPQLISTRRGGRRLFRPCTPTTTMYKCLPPFICIPPLSHPSPLLIDDTDTQAPPFPVSLHGPSLLPLVARASSILSRRRYYSRLNSDPDRGATRKQVSSMDRLLRCVS